jgi:multiple sugar transport system permease protein
MKTGKRMGLSERSIGYLFVLPALIIILLIAIWPVIRSFWISLYDVRLDNPAKTEMHDQYGIDMEGYLNAAPFLLNALDSEIQHAQKGKEQNDLLANYSQVPPI